ncbi:ATP-binding protein [Desulfitobacterium sp.]|uniref:ATP-binding protein n=1 Tax=Desulfitobacterium sp. TaxID=49981 RepID=UPI002C7107BE|nr:ATP-binding protein [Desulfitobacterium sp.]HVJ47835.1 ATP-binding protein [Desulfitobacterium sp.]
MKRGELRQSETLKYQELEGKRSHGIVENLKYSFILEGLVIYRVLREDTVVESLQNLFTSLAEEELDLIKVHQNYYTFCALATEKNWPKYLWDLVLESDNVFSRQASFKAWENLDTGLKNLVIRDLKAVRRIAGLQPEDLQRMVCERMEKQTELPGEEWLERLEQWPLWAPQAGEVQHDSSRAGQFLETTRNEVKKVLLADDEEKAGRELATFYRKIGVGLMAAGLAFKWDGKAKVLVSVTPDPIRKEQLIGQEREQGILFENTNFFLAGYPANNVILYGNRGTGKSSLVKALLQEYCDQGLRLVELSKQDLTDFPLIIRYLAPQPQKFILFIDDLSFEETELAYKALKTVLEGGLEKRPDNVLIYATSNRRHLIRENFSERQGDEVNVRDTLDEKLSLADRFGITITFPSPDQEEYLRIVEELAAQEGLTLEKAQLRQQALRWVMMHNARSGRTARQFIDYLAAQQKVNEQI